jgi:MoaA/NifB/PqqE/SkfB family radical SAM enzyme
VKSLSRRGLKSRNADDLKPDRAEFVGAMELLIREGKRHGTPLAISPDLIRHYRDKWDSQFTSPPSGAWQGGNLPCQAGRLFCSVAPDGRVYPCTYLQDAAPGPDALQLGFSAALKRLVAPDCVGCWCDSFTEANLIFALKPGSILHTLRLLASPRNGKSPDDAAASPTLPRQPVRAT